ncbi:MAG: hypothetical protein CW691_04435 [Candidatus Bathyarchaeum sp.]|nr:MAG: hypothetical protein CW691_04435 [Candidatus Bathyarchaeum sp.]
MKTWNLRALFVSCLLIVLLIGVPVAVADVTEFQVNSTSLQVYRDGLVHVTQTLTVNETLPALTLPLLGSSFDNFIVVDENNTVLDYNVGVTDLTVYSLGATTVSLQYDTPSLTAKAAEEWTFLVNTPYDLTVLLPEDSTILYFSEAPDSIESQGDQILLTLFAGSWEISYVFPINPPADFSVSDLKILPDDNSDEVTVTVTVTNDGTQAGSFEVPFTVNDTVKETKTVTLEEGESTTVEFKVSKDDKGTYNVDVGGLVDKFTINGESTNEDSFPVEYLVVAAVAVVLAVAVFYVLKKRKPNPEKIFKQNPRLNEEEQCVIQFLVDNDGKAFEAEIREKFPNIPRTSLWRLMKRLEKMGVVSIKKIGLENRVELRK